MKQADLDRNEIIEMARQAQVHEELCGEHFIYEFAKLVAAKERGQIIAITETQEFSRMHGEFTPSAYDLVKAIRTRGEAT